MTKVYLLVIVILLNFSSCIRNKHEVLIEAESFKDKGGWVVDPQFVEQMGSPYLLAHGLGNPAKNAKSEFSVPGKGKYFVWVRTKNWSPGDWAAPVRFLLIINGKKLENVLGTEEGSKWQYAGTTLIKDNIVTIELNDLTGFEGRCDAIYLSTEKTNPPDELKFLSQWRRKLLNEGDIPQKTGQYNKEENLYKKAEQDFPDDHDLHYQQSILFLTKGDTIAANRYIEKFKSIRKENSWSEADITTSLAEIYFEAGILEKAEQNYRQALSSVELKPDYTRYFNNLSLFLIDRDRNIEEGMTLVDKVLKVSPDDYLLLDTKGWGLYKLGKFKEALEILKKSWDLRLKNALYDHSAFLHLETAKKAAAGQKNI